MGCETGVPPSGKEVYILIMEKQDNLKEKIKSLSQKFRDETIRNRRHLHSHPELSFQEFETSAFIKSTLDAYHISYREGLGGGTGILALIEGRNPGKKVIALRADMDALPIHEKNEIAYKSANEGVMHACGHDVHTASLLTTAKILSELKDDFEGSIKFIFQPGEEKLPGGASLMIRDGVLENPAPLHVIGQHVMPQLAVGKIGFRKGLYMASADEIYVKVKGKGGHAATPHLNIDPVLIASNIIVSLQQIVSRSARPDIPSVLSFGKVIANGATNVIPDEVNMEGTFRTFDEEWRAEAHAKMKKLAESIAEGMGGSCDFNIIKGYPFLINDVAFTEKLRSYTAEYIGEENIEDIDLWMAAEDFAFYSQRIPSCFYRLGVRNEAEGIVSSVHTPSFNIDENALELGAGLMSWLALKELSEK
jgi:amidohydrolase